jgi:hypothetical protein
VNKRFTKRDDGDWIEVRGFVRRLLGGWTLLIAHNIDLARRVPIGMGDRVQVRGMYEWNDLGGLVHWTHDDPQGIEDGGWVRYRRKIYK